MWLNVANKIFTIYTGAEGWLGFPNLWSGQKTLMELIFNPWYFGEVRRDQLAKPTLLISSLVPLGSFKGCSGAKERMGCGKQREATAPIQSLVKLQPWILSLWWKTCLRQNCSLGSCACSERPDLGEKTLIVMMIYFIYILYIYIYIYISTSSVFCQRAGPSLQTHAARLQFCPKAGLPLKTQEPRLQFY